MLQAFQLRLSGGDVTAKLRQILLGARQMHVRQPLRHLQHINRLPQEIVQIGGQQRVPVEHMDVDGLAVLLHEKVADVAANLQQRRSNLLPQLPERLPFLLDRVIDQIEIAKHRIDDFHTHIRRQPKVDLERVKLAFEAVQGVDQLRFGDDQRLLRLLDLQGELRDFGVLRRTGRAERLLAFFRQLFPQLLEVVAQQFDIQLLVADLQLLLQKPHEAARLRRASALGAATPGARHIQTAEASASKSAKAVQAGTAEHATAARRACVGGRTPRHHVDIKRLLVPLHRANIAQQRAFRYRQTFENAIPARRPQQRLNKAEIKQRDRGVATREIEYQIVGEIHHQIGTRRERLPHR